MKKQWNENPNWKSAGILCRHHALGFRQPHCTGSSQQNYSIAAADFGKHMSPFKRTEHTVDDNQFSS